MNQLYAVLKERKINKVVKYDNSIQIVFTGECVLNLHNPVKFSHDEEDFIGCIVLDIYFTDDELVFELSGKMNFHMSMKASDYTYPEAFELYAKNLIIVDS
jgi:hypothetical protein